MNIPEGWVLVPIKPTEKMLGAAYGILSIDDDARWMAEATWEEMLAAAPKPPEMRSEIASHNFYTEPAGHESFVWPTWSWTIL